MELDNKSLLDQRDISLNEMFAILWRARLLIVIVTVACTGAASLTVWLFPKKYEALVVVAPVSSAATSPQMAGVGALASQFGGLASLVGLSGTGDSKKSETLAVLQSEALTESYIETNNLLPVLYQKQWDAQTMQWKAGDPDDLPTLWKANLYFKKRIRKVTTEAKTGLVTLSITWQNPFVAAKWANDLVKLTNEYLRNKAIAESERNIAYLNSEASKTNILEARQAIFGILQTEINKIMLSRGNEEYALRVLDPAVAPEKPISPQPLLWILAGTFGGFSVAVFAILAKSILQKSGPERH